MNDIRDAMLGAVAEVQKSVKEVMMELVRPQIMAELAQVWASMSDEMREKFKQDNPAAYAELMEQIST